MAKQTGITTNGPTAWFEWTGGDGSALAYGTWDGATLALEFRRDGGAEIGMGADGNLTEGDSSRAFTLPPGDLRFNASGVGASTDLTGETTTI